VFTDFEYATHGRNGNRDAAPPAMIERRRRL
jgi:hypothetical protein